MRYRIIVSDSARADLTSIYDFIAFRASPRTARDFVNRILDYLEGFEHFPARGRVCDDIRPGMRLVGFERRVTIAFTVEDETVIFHRVLYGGRDWEDLI